MRNLFIPIVTIAFLACLSCNPANSGPVYYTDTAPVGDGLKVIGFCFLGAMVVATVGRCFR